MSAHVIVCNMFYIFVNKVNRLCSIFPERFYDIALNPYSSLEPYSYGKVMRAGRNTLNEMEGNQHITGEHWSWLILFPPTCNTKSKLQKRCFTRNQIRSCLYEKGFIRSKFAWRERRTCTSLLWKHVWVCVFFFKFLNAWCYQRLQVVTSVSHWSSLCISRVR